MDIYSTAIAISVVLYLLVGNYAGRRIRGLDDYFVAGRQAPTVLIVGTLTASFLSTNTFLAETGMAYTFWAGPWILFPPLMVMGYVYGALFFGRYLRRSRAMTVADFLGQRFDRRVQIVAGLTIVLGLGGYLLAVTQGAAVILSDLTPLSYTQALMISWASYTAFTIYSGSRGVVLTDTMMFFLFATVTLFGLIYIVDHHGGWAAAFEGLVTLPEKPGLMAWHGMTGPGMQWETPFDMAIWQIVIALAWGLVVAISPWQSSRYLIARNEQVVIRSACIAAVTIVSIQVGLYATAATVNLTKTDIEPMESTMIWAATDILPSWLGALMLAGLMAAALSSATTFLSLVGFSLSHDILPRRGALLNEQRMLRFSRLMMLAVGLVVLVIALVMPLSIWLITNVVGPSFASSWGPVAFMSVWSDRITAKAAFWGMIVGFALNVVPRLMEIAGWITLPVYLHPIVIGSVSGLAVILLLSKRAEVTDAERSFRLKLHETPAEEKAGHSARTTRRIAWILAVFGISVTLFFSTSYVAPYQELTGRLNDGAINWFTGEGIEALGWAVVCTAFAILAYTTVKRSYGSDTKVEPDLVEQDRSAGS